MSESPFLGEWKESFMAPLDEQEAHAKKIAKELVLAQELVKYGDMEVAIHNSEVVAAAETPDELETMIAGREIDGTIHVLPPSNGADFWVNAA